MGWNLSLPNLSSKNNLHNYTTSNARYSPNFFSKRLLFNKFCPTPIIKETLTVTFTMINGESWFLHYCYWVRLRVFVRLVGCYVWSMGWFFFFFFFLKWWWWVFFSICRSSLMMNLDFRRGGSCWNFWGLGMWTFVYSCYLAMGFFIWVGLRWLVCGGGGVCNSGGEAVVGSPQLDLWVVVGFVSFLVWFGFELVAWIIANVICSLWCGGCGSCRLMSFSGHGGGLREKKGEIQRMSNVLNAT